MTRCADAPRARQVGAIDASRIDTVWEAAMKHGFKLVPDPA